MSEIVQGSAEWFAERLGKVTASRVADVVAKTRNGWGASRANYEAQLIAERLTGVVAESYTNQAMQWGIDTEPQARAAYEFLHDVEVVEVGFVQHPTILNSGASPDGLIGNDGLIEIKSPNTATHIATLLDSKIPEKYVKQMLWQMACTQRKWCDFVSFDPRLPHEMQLFVSRMDRDEKRISELEDNVAQFLQQVDLKTKELLDKYAKQ